MKNTILLVALVFSISLSSATIGTYTGDLESEGPETSFLVGFASDQPVQLDLEVIEPEGLNVEYNNSVFFEPEGASKTVQHRNGQLPLKELFINVNSIDPVEEVYEIPVTLRAFNPESEQSQTSPKIVHEREYTFYYRTELSSNYGFEGDLIRPDENRDLNENSEGREENQTNVSKENTITGKNQTSSQGEGQESETRSRTTYLLIAGIIVVFGYVLKEALI